MTIMYWSINGPTITKNDDGEYQISWMGDLDFNLFTETDLRMMLGMIDEAKKVSNKSDYKYEHNQLNEVEVTVNMAPDITPYEDLIEGKKKEK